MGGFSFLGFPEPRRLAFAPTGSLVMSGGRATARGADGGVETWVSSFNRVSGAPSLSSGAILLPHRTREHLSFHNEARATDTAALSQGAAGEAMATEGSGCG